MTRKTRGPGQRKQNIIDKNSAEWERRAAESKKKKLLLHEYTCEVCNRPFTDPRPPHPNRKNRCPPCRRFTRLQQKRDSYWRHPEKKRSQMRQYMAAKYTPATPQDPSQVKPVRSTPVPRSTTKNAKSKKPQPRTNQDSGYPIYRDNNEPKVVWSPE